jgi:hypothetical protein
MSLFIRISGIKNGVGIGEKISPKSWSVNGKKQRKSREQGTGSRESRGGKKVTTPQGASREAQVVRSMGRKERKGTIYHCV